jgi:hypothetical protein
VLLTQLAEMAGQEGPGLNVPVEDMEAGLNHFFS